MDLGDTDGHFHGWFHGDHSHYGAGNQWSRGKVLWDSLGVVVHHFSARRRGFPSIG